MALCDYLISTDITGYDCSEPHAKGAEREGLLINRADIDTLTVLNFTITVFNLKCGGKKAYKISQSGKQPFTGTQQEMVEGANFNTITNTLQFVVLKQDKDWAEQLFALVNGEFVAVLQNKEGNYQVYGAETGLHCAGAVRELYSDDNLSGWVVTMTEEGAVSGSLFLDDDSMYSALQEATAACE